MRKRGSMGVSAGGLKTDRRKEKREEVAVLHVIKIIFLLALS